MEIKKVVDVVISELMDHALMPMDKLYLKLGTTLPHESAKALMEAKEEIEEMVARLDLVIMPAIQIPREDMTRKYEEPEIIVEKEYVAAAGKKRSATTQIVDLAGSDGDDEQVNAVKSVTAAQPERPIKDFKRKKAEVADA